MMAHKHLRELLMEDQEPFHLKNYIADRRCQIKPRPTQKSNLQLKKIQTSTSKLTMCRHACFFSFHDSPDVRKSPFLDLPSPSPVKSPCKSPVFLQIPSRTAAMLLEAAARIQKNSSVKSKSPGFGLFGSILKRLKYKNRIKMCEVPESMKENRMSVDEMKFSCSCRLSSAATSTSSSPSSPFRFSLQKSPSSGRQTPEFLSPASSPARPSKQEEDNYKEKVKKEEEEAEEKEQCSPVSVLDPPFEDDEIGQYEDGADDYHLECSYAIVQKVKQQLLHKLRRFERLAELDPVELEKRLSEEQDDDDEDDEDLTNGTATFSDGEEEEENMNIVKAVYGKTCSSYMNNLVLDLVYEEKKNGAENNEIVINRVCKRLDSWKEVESNTIDMMVELDFRREIDGWKRCDEEQMRETVMEIELGIFGVLIEELAFR